MAENLSRAPDPEDAVDPPRRKTSLAVRVFRVLLVVLGIVVIGIALLVPAPRTSREAHRRALCSDNLHQIATALQLYAAANGGLPPAHTTDANGKPLHSWRTLILPYLERQQLYESIDLAKPWDDPANAAACRIPLSIYQCPSMPGGDNHTTYLAIVTPESCLRVTESRNPAEITDGSSRTLMLIDVDAEHAVPWMAPVDADEGVVLGIGSQFKPSHPGGFLAAFVDGHIRFFPEDLSAAQRRALISIAGDDDAMLRDEY